MEDKKAKIESPMHFGNKGEVGGDAGTAPGGEIQSPVKATNMKEAKGHDNGK